MKIKIIKMIKNLSEGGSQGCWTCGGAHRKADCPKPNCNGCSGNFKPQICLNCGGRHATTSCFKLKNKVENNVSVFMGTKRSEIRAEMSDHCNSNFCERYPLYDRPRFGKRRKFSAQVTAGGSGVDF